MSDTARNIEKELEDKRDRLLGRMEEWKKEMENALGMAKEIIRDKPQYMFSPYLREMAVTAIDKAFASFMDAKAFLWFHKP